MRLPLLSFALLLVLGTSAFAGDVVVTGGWFRALPASVPSGGYFTLHNGSNKTITLTGASSPACGMLMLHKTEDKGGTMNMMDMPSIPVPAGTDLKFAPGGYHLMCTDATSAMKPGATVPVTLELAGGAKLSANFAVKNARGQ
jgi:copper(I)-binding protein